VLHADRSRACSFGGDAERYDRARPSYPADVLDALGAAAGQRVLDVGCGTGIASRLFASRGCVVLGVEPDERMAAVARRTGVAVEVSAFEDWDAAGRRFDLVVSGQAWHWVDPDRGAAKAADVLVPGGRAGLFWNCGEPEAGLDAVLRRIYRDLAPGVDTHSVVLGNRDEERFDAAAAGIERTASFGTVARPAFPWSRRYTRDEWLDQLPTHSDHQALPPPRLEALLTAVGQAIDDHGGSFTMGYRTVAIIATRS
jgi:SAM-dependent methyltransferase